MATSDLHVGLPLGGLFRPPGALADLKPENLQGWSKRINDMMESSVVGDRDDPMDGPRTQFFNPLTRSVDKNTVVIKDINWRAFPKKVQAQHDGNDRARWKAADADRDVQDEYCEWSMERNEEGKITRITFTCEGPEYWQYLAEVQPDTLVQLYKEHVNPSVEKADLFNAQGKYVEKNRWNSNTSTGAMHLTMRANTLGAEVELAAAATILRLKKTGTTPELMTDPQELIKCGRYGQPGRHSDPHIGAEVNAIARQEAIITLVDPVCLSFDAFLPVNFKTPDGADASTFMTWTRGSPGQYLRGVFEVPKDKNYVVGDVKINGRTIEWGAQVADYLTVKLTGLAAEAGRHTAQPKDGCIAPPAEARSLLASRPIGRTRQLTAESHVVHRWVVGIDGDAPRGMSRDEAEELLQDAFGKQVLLVTPPEQRPQSLDAVARAIKALPTDKKYRYPVFFAGDGGQITLQAQPYLDRSYRYVWVRMPDGSAKSLEDNLADIMVVAGAREASTSTTTFLQLAAWDETNKVFNYYQRIAGSGMWTWVGNSLHAFDPRTRGKGPFDGHVNGSLVMKELRQPWSHWHSGSASIVDECVPEPTRFDPYFKAKEQADDLERYVVLPGIDKWTGERLARAVEKDPAAGMVKLTGKLGGAPALLQHVLRTTTINLRSSNSNSKTRDPVQLPTNFFINSAALGEVLDLPSVKLEVPSEMYQRALSKLDVHLRGATSSNKPVCLPGDTHFAFLVPEPAHEDVVVITQLLLNEWFSERFLMCCLLVDFPNPVYSTTREKLMQYIPDAAEGLAQLEKDMVENIRKGAAQGAAPAKEFLRWWDDPHWKASAEDVIGRYLEAAAKRCTEDDGVETFLSMAHYRRSQYRNFNDELNEFALTLPCTGKPLFSLKPKKEYWRMNEQCQVVRDEVAAEAAAAGEAPYPAKRRLHCTAVQPPGVPYQPLAACSSKD